MQTNMAKRGAVRIADTIGSSCQGTSRATQAGDCQTGVPSMTAPMGNSTVMETQIDLGRLHYADLLKLGQLAAEAMALSQQYDQSRSRAYCELIAACNVEMLTRRHRAERRCGTALPRAEMQAITFDSTQA